MIKIVDSINQLRFSELMDVYSEGNLENGKERYPNLPEDAQIRESESDFYNYLKDYFFPIRGAFYALWEVDHLYAAALRMEPYKDGWLLSALETAPDQRRRGYAGDLICEVIHYVSKFERTKIYSHVSKRNIASIATHEKCGFHIEKDYAVYLDGSVLRSSYTLVYDMQKSETF